MQNDWRKMRVRNKMRIYQNSAVKRRYIEYVVCICKDPPEINDSRQIPPRHEIGGADKKRRFFY